MKKILVKTIKYFLYLLLVLIAISALAIIWPMPSMAVPERYGKIYIESIDVIDVKTGNILTDRHVLIENNQIRLIDSVKLNSEKYDLKIDGQGKFLIPGLWDMHTHSNQQSEWLHHPLYIANGVTGVRDMSGQLNEKDSYWVGSRERLTWNSELNADKRVTPRYVLQSSYQMDGASAIPSSFPDFFRLENSAQVDSLLNFYKNEDADFIKVYQQIIPESYKRLAQEAPKYGLHLAGHKPVHISLEDAVNMGQKSFEHGRIFFFESFPGADSLRNTTEWKAFYSKSKQAIVEDFNIEKAKQLMILMKEKKAYWVPTLQTLKFEAYAHDENFTNNPNLKYISSARKNLWWRFDINNNKERNLSSATEPLSLKMYNSSMAQVNLANQIGVPIMSGTDVTDSFTYAGFSLHQELEDLTKSGLTNLEALQSATIVPAKYANKEDLYGALEPGKIADMIILNANPLVDIRNSKSILGVFLNGIYYDTEKLKELKDYTESLASSFHVNMKVVYSFIGSPLIRVQFAD